MRAKKEELPGHLSAVVESPAGYYVGGEDDVRASPFFFSGPVGLGLLRSGVSKDGAMSTVAYAALTTRRQEATPHTSADPAGQDPANPQAGKPGVGPWLDTAAALVPAEVLAANAFLIQQVTTTTKDPTGKTVVTLSNTSNAQTLFWSLLVLSLAIYVGAHWSKWDAWDFLRMLIPPGAFVLWSALQSGTAFDAVAHWSEFTRYLIGVMGAILLGYMANKLAYKADAKAPPKVPPKVPPNQPAAEQPDGSVAAAGRT